MIYHSIIPLEIVMQDEKSANDYFTKTIQYQGCQVEVLTSATGSTQIRRVFSTSLKDYLNPKLQPGSNIEGM